jgi:hypothetical protein
MSPMTSPTALDAFYLEARSKILDLAAILDRVGRGGGAGAMDGDPRLDRIHRALEVLMDESPARAERIQQIFSLDYDPAWERPRPRF